MNIFIMNLPGRQKQALLHRVLFCILFFFVAAGLQAQDFTGNWNITHAKGMGGKSYGGQVDIRHLSDLAYDISSYDVSWKGDAANYDGVALKVNNTLYTGYATGKNSNYGIVLYRPGTDGSLSGIWTGNGFNGATGSELISGNAKNLDGTYTISGQTPDGKYYNGSITIHPAGEVYTCTWNIGESTYSGVGILQNGIFAVGYGTSADYGLAQYEFNTNKNIGKGTWTQAGATITSYEDIQKQ